jgi:hypothetical protein
MKEWQPHQEIFQAALSGFDALLALDVRPRWGWPRSLGGLRSLSKTWLGSGAWRAAGSLGSDSEEAIAGVSLEMAHQTDSEGMCIHSFLVAVKGTRSRGWEYGLVVEYLPSTCKTLDLIPVPQSWGWEHGY